MLVQRRVVVWLLCCAAAGFANAAGLPAWMGQPPADDDKWWYATGEGPDLEAARRLALRGVAAKLRASVEGAITNTTRVQSTNGKEQVDIKADSSVIERVAQTDFTRFEVVQSARGGQGVYALVRVDRAAFMADTRNQLQVLDKPVRDVETALSQQNTLDQYMALRRVSRQLEDGVRLSLLLQGAGAADEGQAGFRRYAGLQYSSKDVASRLTFELRHAPADADIASLLAAYLTEQGIRTSRQRLPGASALTITSDGREDDLFGSKMLKLKVRLAVLDDKGRAAASRDHELPGSSRYDFKGAREDALRKWGDNLRKAGPLVALGFPD